MTEDKLKSIYANKGYYLVRGGGEHNYVLIPINNPNSLWGSFDSLESAEQALKQLDEVKSTVKQTPHPIKKGNISFFSLKNEVEYCLNTNGIKAVVCAAKKGEHTVKIWSDTNIDGLEFDSGRHKIRIGIGSDMFGNKFYTGGRIRI